MRGQFSEHREIPASDDSQGRWYTGFDDEQFIHLSDSGWYVESREGEFGPFQRLKDAEDFYYKRFRI